MNALATARRMVDRHGERGVELATNRFLLHHYWTKVRPRDVTATEKRDFWNRVAYRAHVLVHGTRPETA